MSPGGKRWQCFNRKPASPHLTRGGRRQEPRWRADGCLQAVGGFSPGGASLLCSGPSPSLRLRGPRVCLRRAPSVWLCGLHGHGAPGLHTAQAGPLGPRPRRPPSEGGDPASQPSRPLSAAPRPAALEMPGGAHAPDKQGSPGRGPSASSCQINGKTLETETDFIFLGSKITEDGDYSPEIKRFLLLGEKL